MEIEKVVHGKFLFTLHAFVGERGGRGGDSVKLGLKFFLLSFLLLKRAKSFDANFLFYQVENFENFIVFLSCKP